MEPEIADLKKVWSMVASWEAAFQARVVTHNDLASMFGAVAHPPGLANFLAKFGFSEGAWIRSPAIGTLKSELTCRLGEG